MVKNIPKKKDRQRLQWERLGKYDPYWAVLTSPDKSGRKWDSDEFFNTGGVEISDILQTAKQLGLRMSFDTALDFGCGVGRLSRPLAENFTKVIGVDFSTSMLDEAKRVNESFRNIHFLHNPDNNLTFIENSSIDFLYSNIVLQHIPKDRQISFLIEFCRVLKTQGILAIQVPAKCNLHSWRGWVHFVFPNFLHNFVRRLKYGPSGVMEIYTLPRAVVVATLESGGLEVLDIQRYDSTGNAFEGYMYFARKV